MASILPDKLRTFKYYVEKLPLYLQNSYGFIEHFRIWYDFMMSNSTTNGMIDVADLILYLLNIFDDDFLDTIKDLDGANVSVTHPYGTKSDILDKLGLFFGVSRNFSVDYIEHDEPVNEELSLDNKDFLTLIKCEIIKNYCEGTYEQISSYYASAGLNVYVLTDNDNPATSYLYLAEIIGSSEYSDDVKTMFKAGMLRIESMGIEYINLLETPSGLLIWDTSYGSLEGWDVGVWIE